MDLAFAGCCYLSTLHSESFWKPSSVGRRRDETRRVKSANCSTAQPQPQLTHMQSSLHDDTDEIYQILARLIDLQRAKVDTLSIFLAVLQTVK